MQLTPDEYADIARSGIVTHGILPEPRLAAALSQHAYAIVTTGNVSDDEGTAAAIARLSLPGRILFIAATSNTPVIVLGSEETPASKFVKRFGIGVTSPYHPDSFREAVAHVTAPAVHAEMRRKAAAIAGALSSEGAADWVLQSLEMGLPVDDRFEALMPRSEADVIGHLKSPVSSSLPLR
jgi:hypothetical protein